MRLKTQCYSSATLYWIRSGKSEPFSGCHIALGHFTWHLFRGYRTLASLATNPARPTNAHNTARLSYDARSQRRGHSRHPHIPKFLRRRSFALKRQELISVAVHLSQRLLGAFCAPHARVRLEPNRPSDSGFRDFTKQLFTAILTHYSGITSSSQYSEGAIVVRMRRCVGTTSFAYEISPLIP